MVLQGGDMALNFGAYYKFGTRFVDSQSNDDFNAMKKNPTILTNLLAPHREELFKAFQETIAKNSDPMQRLVMTKAYDLEILKIEQNVKLLLALPQAYYDAIFQVNQKIQTSVGEFANQDTDNTPDKFLSPQEKADKKKQEEQDRLDNIHKHTPGEHGHKSLAQIKQEEEELIKYIQDQDEAQAPQKLKEYTTFLAQLSSVNQSLRSLREQIEDLKANTRLPVGVKANAILMRQKNIKTFEDSKAAITRSFTAWKRNNTRWMANQSWLN